jgi:hypothetical protein
MAYKTIVKTPPTEEPFLLSEAKRQLQLEDSTLQDAHIETLIPIARDRVEKYCNRFFTQQVVYIVYDEGFPGGKVLELPYPDLASVDSITYYDSTETQQTFTGFTFDSQRQAIIADDSFPDAVSITIEVTTSAPAEYQGAKSAMLMTLTDLYELRTESVVGFSIGENKAVVNAMQPYRVEMGV